MMHAAIWYLKLLKKCDAKKKLFSKFHIKYCVTRVVIWYLKKPFVIIILNIVWRMWPFDI